MVKDKKA